MKNQQTMPNTHTRLSSLVIRRFSIVIISIMLTIGGVIGGMSLTDHPAAAESIESYCNKYSGKFTEYGDNTARNACKAGITGKEDCSDYGQLFDAAIAKICTDEAQNHPKGLTESTPTTSPSPTISPSTPDENDNSGTKDNPTYIQNILDQTKSLSDYLDVLHGAGPDAETDTSKEPDNNYDSYVNGAGKQQKIIPIKQGTGSSPVILFFNGGGWHANDKAGEYVAGMKVDGGLFDNTGAENAGDRGYAMFDVTYRLGSSGVYYMFEDVMRGIKHMRENASIYGIDPNKIVIWGDSAGGSLSMRAAASGKSGAKAAVGWSAPTNAYTALFKSFQSFGIGMDHSTCIPTDLAGFANFADLANGGSGDVAQYGQGLSSNDLSALGIDIGSMTSTGQVDAMALLTQGLIAGKNALSTFSDIESISSQIKSGGGLSGSTFNLASKKFTECLDNFNVLSPALFASPDTPPSFLAEFEDDGLIDPAQSYGMRDKLLQLGIKSEALVLPGSDECMKSAAAPAGAGGCHLGYFKDFVCPTLNFIDSVVQPERGTTNCSTGVAENAGTTTNNAPANSGSGSGGGGSSSSQNGTSSNNGGKSTATAEDTCPAGTQPAGGTSNASGTKVTCKSTSTQTSAADACRQRGPNYNLNVNTGQCVDTVAQAYGNMQICNTSGGTWSWASETCTSKSGSTPTKSLNGWDVINSNGGFYAR